MMVSATNALSEIRLAPSAHNASFMFKKYRKSAAAMRLLPSWNEWFFTTKYSRFAAFSSRVGYISCPPKPW